MADTPVPTDTTVPTDTPAPTDTAVPTSTDMPVPTSTDAPVNTPSTTSQLTQTPTTEPTTTVTPTVVKPTATLTPTVTPSATPKATATPTNKTTNTPTNTPTTTLQLSQTPSPTATVKPTNTPSPSATARPTTTSQLSQTPSPSATARPTTEPTPTDESTATETPKITPIETYNGGTPVPTYTPTPSVLYFDGAHTERFAWDERTYDEIGTYHILHESNYYDAYGKYAGTLHSGDQVFVSAESRYYVTHTDEATTIPACGLHVYRVVVNDTFYYMNPADLYGFTSVTNADGTVTRTETSADNEGVIAWGMAYNGTISSNKWVNNVYGETYEINYAYWYNSNGVGQPLYIACTNTGTGSGWMYFATQYSNGRVRDNAMTYLYPFTAIIYRERQDALDFTYTDEGYTYHVTQNTIGFIDTDNDGYCETELTTELWEKYQAFNY